MGKIDALTKKYMSNSSVFADAFNFYIYGGEQVIKPENLHPLDTTAVGIPFGKGTKGQPVQKYRDILKYITAMEDEKAAYLVLGIENQANIHYAMPPRNLLYDALEYTRQVEKISASHRKENNKIFHNTAEYLSGFYREDRLLPVITLVVYFGAEVWDAPRNLYEMLEVKDKRVLNYVNNYHLNLIVPAELQESDFEKFKTDLREVMKYIQCSIDKHRLSWLVENDDKFSRMDRNTAMLLNECTGSGLKFCESEGSVDMCKAIRELRQEWYEEGQQKGREEGREKGREEGREEGREKGREEGEQAGTVNSLKALIKNLGFSLEHAMDILEIPEDKRQYIVKIYKEIQ